MEIHESWNIKKISISTIPERVYYSLGAATGSVTGLLLSTYIVKLL